jgi:hypothetical protein
MTRTGVPAAIAAEPEASTYSGSSAPALLRAAVGSICNRTAPNPVVAGRFSSGEPDQNMLCRLAVILALLLQPALVWGAACAPGSGSPTCAPGAPGAGKTACCCAAAPTAMKCCGPGSAVCNCGVEPDDADPAVPPSTSGLDQLLLLAPVTGAAGIEWGGGPIGIGRAPALFPLPSENNTRQALLCVWRT